MKLVITLFLTAHFLFWFCVWIPFCSYLVSILLLSLGGPQMSFLYWFHVFTQPSFQSNVFCYQRLELFKWNEWKRTENIWWLWLGWSCGNRCYWQATCCRTGRVPPKTQLKLASMGKKADKVRRIIAHVYNKQDKQLDDSTFAYTSDSDDSDTHSEVDETRSLVSYSDEECGSESDHADGPTEDGQFPILYYTHVQEGYLNENFRTSYTEHSVSVSY